MKLYTFGWVIDGPGSRTREPVPKDMTGYAVGAPESWRCASIERLLFEAQTVQNFSLYESVAAPAGLAVSRACVAEAISACVDVSGGGGGGGGGGWGVEVPEFVRRGSYAILRKTMEGNRETKGVVFFFFFLFFGF